MKITAIAPWFGAKRVLASRIVAELGLHRAYWEPMCGSRFAAAVDSIPDWHRRLREVTILRRDLFEILPRIEDRGGTVIYVDLKICCG